MKKKIYKPKPEPVKVKTFIDKLRENVTLIISLCVLGGFFLSAFAWFDNRYAQKKVELKLDYVTCSILNDLNNQKIEKLMARAPNGIENADPSTKEQLQLWMEKKEKLKKKIEALEKEGIGAEVATP